MNISLEEYREFAKKLNLFSHKDFNGLFTYVDKDTGDVIHPYLLGKLYRLVKQESINELTKMNDSFEFDIIKEKHKLKELPSVVKEEIESQKAYIQSLQEEIQ